MGFMDKAKQMADQAQKKIEETQKQFNDSQAQKAGPDQSAGEVRYDVNGRPIADPATAPAVAQPQPPAAVEGPDAATGEVGAAPGSTLVPEAPAAPGSAVVPEAPAAPEDVHEEHVPPPAPPKEGMNTSPDPFKPIQ